MINPVPKLPCMSAICVALLALLFSGCAAYRVSAQPFTFNITSPENGAELSTNLANITGTVSSPDAIVKVQGHKAYVDALGNFIGYALLSEGANTVEVKASAHGQTRSQSIELSFSPPLAVYLDDPQVTPDLQVHVTGDVNYPQAAVTVGSVPVTVAPDGSFSATIPADTKFYSVKAVATLGTQQDSYIQYYGIGMVMAPSPPPYPFYAEFERVVYMQAGDNFTQRVNLFVSNYIINKSSTLSYRLTPTPYKSYTNATLPWPDGLELSIIPSDFPIYPNASYSCLMVIKTAAGLASNVYDFGINTIRKDGSEAGQGDIKVVIQPSGGSIEKTIEVNQSGTVGGITFTLQHVELSSTGMTVDAFNTPVAYAHPQGATPQPLPAFLLNASLSYSIDGGIVHSAGFSGTRLLDNGTQNSWAVDLPVPKGSKTLELTISLKDDWNTLDWQGPWKFVVPLE